MSQVEELQMRIRNLPTEDFSKLREWFLQLEGELWDQQISADFKAGKFNKLIEKARAEFAQGYTGSLKLGVSCQKCKVRAHQANG